MAKIKKKKIDKIPVKVKNYLDKTGINHEILEHKTVYTAIDAANTLNKKLTEIAKSLLIKADKDYYLILLPADYNLQEEKLRKIIEKGGDKQIKAVKIPGEKLVEKTLNIRAGALSAFGNLYKLPVIVDKKLAETKKAIFSSGSLNHSVEMAVKDFVKLENAVLANFGIKKKIKVQKITPKKKTSSKVKPKAKKKSTTTKKKIVKGGEMKKNQKVIKKNNKSVSKKTAQVKKTINSKAKKSSVKKSNTKKKK